LKARHISAHSLWYGSLHRDLPASDQVSVEQYRAWQPALFSRRRHTNFHSQPRSSKHGRSPRHPRHSRNGHAEAIRDPRPVARIAPEAETLTNEFIKAELFRTSYFDDSIHRSTDSSPSHGCGYIFCNHGLDQHRGQPDRRTVARRIGDIFDKLEELGRVNNRIRNGGLCDQFLLSELRTEVSANRFLPVRRPFWARRSVPTTDNATWSRTPAACSY